MVVWVARQEFLMRPTTQQQPPHPHLTPFPPELLLYFRRLLFLGGKRWLSTLEREVFSGGGERMGSSWVL